MLDCRALRRTQEIQPILADIWVPEDHRPATGQPHSMEDLANLIVATTGAYAGLGIIFAIAFLFFGASRVDPVAKDGSWGFRLLILPGCVALWPILARRWWSGGPPPSERNAHRDAAQTRGSER